MLYGEDVYVGYRYYEKVGLQPLFSFGHGLSYTSFRLSNMQVTNNSAHQNKFTQETLDISVVVENVGSCRGAEIAQVYLAPPRTTKIARPARELKGFEKVSLDPGEKRQVTITILTSLATSYWDESRSAWLSEMGKYTITVVGTGEGNSVSQSFSRNSSIWWNGLPGPAANDAQSPRVNGVGRKP